MRKKLLVIPVLILVSLFLTGCVKKPGTTSGGQSTEQKKESFTGKIKDAFSRDVPLKCECSSGENSSVGYIKNKKYYGETTTKEGKSHVIITDNCMWSWQENKNEGIKICFNKSEENDIWSSDNVPKDDYNCNPAVFADSIFSPPASVNFLDMDEMMKKAGVTIPAVKGE